MPLTAIGRARPDHVVPLAEMSDLLDALVPQPPRPTPAGFRSAPYEAAVARKVHSTMVDMGCIAGRSVPRCLDYGGVRWEIDEGGPRFRCHPAGPSQ